MQITDTIADMLTRIRNANSAKHASVDIPASNLKKQIAQILQDEGYIKSFKVMGKAERELPRRKTGLAACGRRHTRRHNDTPALNTLKVLRGAPISMGRGETPVRLQLTTARFCLLTNIVYPYRKRRFF